MAVVVDPDNLDRNQVIFATNPQEVSLYPVGALVNAAASSNTATTSTGSDTFHDANGSYVTWGVNAGDVLVLRNGPDAAHLIVSAVTNASTLEIATDDGFTTFADASGLVYSINEPTGGSIADGVSKQALYSFAKEEWHTDTYATVLTDDLIQHEFPYEAITRESMEIGGGTAHADWVYFNDYTRKKIRTGGWADKNAAATASTEYAGIITLGTLDDDAQVYYQQVSAQNTPVDFTFQGVVNEPILTYVSAGVDYRSFLKLFVRKKGKTYAGSEIADIGVTQLEPIVNRFPLSHTDDAAITASDAQIIGVAPYRTGVSVVTEATNGQTSAITSTEAAFRTAGTAQLGTSTVLVGDTVFITGTQTDAGYYTITSVRNTSVCTIDTTEAGILTGATGLDYDIFSIVMAASKSSNRASALQSQFSATNVSVGIVSTSDAEADYVNRGVAAGDLVAIVSSNASAQGIYTITSVLAANRLEIDIVDNTSLSGTGNIFVYTPGMFLQHKNDPISIAAHGSIVFTSTNATYSNYPTIGRATGSWSSDGVSRGTIVTFGSTTSNNKSFTIVSVENASTITCVSTDSSRMINETATGVSTTAYDAFKRTINNRVYGFKWRLTGNTGSAGDCYQFIQHQLRQTTDIDWGPKTFRGDVTDLLMAYSFPTGTTTNLIIDNIDADDTNNVTYADTTGVSRSFPFVASFTYNFNSNLQNDADAKFWTYYTTNPSGNYSTNNAVLVVDSNGSAVVGNVGGNPSKQFTYDYDGNTDGGRTAATDANITIVAIGKNTAQFIITTGTITRAKGLSFSLVANLERNYSNP